MALRIWIKAVGLAGIVAPVALVTPGSVSATPSASKNAIGQVSCSFSSGVLKLKPPSHPLAGTPETVKATLTATAGGSNSCSGSATVGGKPATIVGARLHVREVLVQFLEGDPDHPLVVGPVYGGAVKWRVSLPNSKVARTAFSFTGGSWVPPTATVPPSGGNLTSVTGSFGGSGATINITLGTPGLFSGQVLSKHTAIPITGGSISDVSGTCPPFGC